MWVSELQLHSGQGTRSATMTSVDDLADSGSETVSDAFGGSELDEYDDDAFDFFSGHVTGTSPENDQDEANEHIESRPPLVDVNDIRVIYIHPPSPGSENTIRCHFERTSLVDPCEYFALSYAWGSNTNATETILIDDRPFSTPPTLLAALHRLRELGTWLPAIWIDAICIDQENPIERSRQVMLMGQIYSKGRHLVIWLGELEDEPPPIQDWEIEDLTSLPIGDVNRHSTLQASETRIKMRQRAYFTRRWVIQEVFCSPGPHTILVGGFRLLATNVADVLEDQARALEFVHSGLEMPAFTPGPGTIQDRDQQNRSLFLNLFDFASKKCSDDRDIVYALRGVSCDGRHLEVDYTKDTTTTYTTLARKWIAAGHLMAVLQLAILQKLRLQNWKHANAGSDTPFVRAGPSWVPIWNAPSTSVSLFRRTNIFGETRRSVSLLEFEQVYLQPSIPPQDSWADRINGEGDCLHLQGSILVQCEHYFKINIDCAYCFLFGARQNLPNATLQREVGAPAGGIWCVLTEPGIAFGVDISAQQDDVAGRQAYILRTPVYAVSTEDLKSYDAKSSGPFKFSDSSTVTLV